jgi:biotin carboxylase
MITGISIGGGVEQVPSIIKAKEMGFRVVIVDRNPSAPGFQYADESAVIDIKNEDEVIRYARRENVSFVIPAPIGRFITTVGAVNDALHLTGISRRAAVNCSDKMIFNNLMRKANLSVPGQIAVLANKKSLTEALQNISALPCVLKPQYGSGSRGVVLIQSDEQAHKFLNNCERYLQSLHKDEKILIEKYIQGREYGLDAIKVQDKFHLILLREKVLNSHCIVITYKSPADVEHRLLQKITQEMERAAESLELNDCLIQADMIIDQESKIPYIIELSGRPSGLFIHQNIVPHVTGTDFIEIGILLLLRKYIDINIKHWRPVINSYFPLSGRIMKMPEEKEIQSRSYIIAYHLPFMVGDIVPEIISTRDILQRGWVAITGINLQDAENNLVHFLSDFTIL